MLLNLQWDGRQVGAVSVIGNCVKEQLVRAAVQSSQIYLGSPSAQLKTALAISLYNIGTRIEPINLRDRGIVYLQVELDDVLRGIGEGTPSADNMVGR